MNTPSMQAARRGRDFAPERAAAVAGTMCSKRGRSYQGAAGSGKKRVRGRGVERRLGGTPRRRAGRSRASPAMRRSTNWPDALEDACASARRRRRCSGIEHGFEAPDFAIVAEQDILGDRMVRPRARRKRAQNFLTEASSLAPGDLVTHIEHGIGRYVRPADHRRRRRAA